MSAPGRLTGFHDQRLSVFNESSRSHVSVVLKAYYDGSGSSSDPATPRITLAGFAAPPDTWTRFDNRWPNVLKGDGSSHPPCKYLHMNELAMFMDEYEGWNEEQQNALLRDVYKRFYSLAWDRDNNFRALICKSI
jgi:hypothetical protein